MPASGWPPANRVAQALGGGPREHRALHAADVGQHRAGFKGGRQSTDKIQRGAGRDGQHDELGAGHRACGVSASSVMAEARSACTPSARDGEQPTTRGIPARRACHANEPPMAPSPITASDEGRTTIPRVTRRLPPECGGQRRRRRVRSARIVPI